MSPTPFRALLAFAALAAAVPVHAATCYLIFDRNDNVVYRDVVPPVDMSTGSPAREAMRQRGEYLMFVELDRCPRVEFITGSAGDARLDFTRTAPATPGSATPPPDGVRPMGRAPRS